MKKNKVVAIVVVALLLIGIAAAYIIHRSLQAVQDSYALWDVARAIVQHMEAHQDQWPTGWEDVRHSYVSLTVLKGGLPWEEIPKRVEVDFLFSPMLLLKGPLPTADAPLRVVWLKNGDSHHWSCAEPNEIILDHILKRNKE
jgi:hypothetical protein